MPVKLANIKEHRYIIPGDVMAYICVALMRVSEAFVELARAVPDGGLTPTLETAFVRVQRAQSVLYDTIKAVVEEQD